MMLGKLTRFPGVHAPAEAFGGHGLLNAYLADLDSRLLGSARVRMQTLAEVRDHLEEKARYHVNAGHAEHEAAELAIQSMPVEAQVAAQRSLLLKKFVRLATPSGLFFGVFMAAIWSFTPGASDRLAFIWVLWLSGGMLFGVYLGWYGSFIMPERELPTTTASAPDGSTAQGLVVSYSRTMRILGACMSIFFLLLAPGSLVLGLIGMFDPAAVEVFFLPWWVFLLLVPIMVFDFYMVRLAARRYEALEDVIVVRDFLGMPRRYPVSRLIAVGNLGEVRKWLPHYWKRVHYAEFERAGTKPVRLLIYPDMINADRLFTMLRQHLDSGAPEE